MMTRKKGPITAEELIGQLRTDPEYQKMMQEKEKSMKILEAELNRDEEELVKEIKEKGIEIDSVWDLVNNVVKHSFLHYKFTGRYNVVYSILVDHLDRAHHPKIREGIIRALIERDAKEIAKDKLLEHFYKETDSNLKWVLSNALTIMLTRTEKRANPDVGIVRRKLV